MNRASMVPVLLRRCATAALFAALTSALFGCRAVDIAARRVALDGGPDSGACGRQGPRARVGDNALSAAECTQGEPSHAFIHALCVCSDYTAGNDLTTYAFDSSAGSSAPSPAGGSVGINGALVNNGFVMEIGGSLQIAGPTGATLSSGAELNVSRNLEMQGPIQGAQAGVSVSGDARVGGRIALNDLRVDGALAVPGGVNIDVTGSRQIGRLITEAVRVEPPCGCSDEDLVDIAALVGERRNDNDNAALEFDPAELEDYVGPIRRKLPCGRFHLARLSGRGQLTLEVTGRAALYVDQHVDFQGPVTVELGADAELDLFLADTMLARGDLVFGDNDGSSRVRLYVGGGGTLELQGQNLLSGFIYAPRSELVVTGPTEVHGAVFVRRAAPASRLTIYFGLNSTENGQVCASL